MASSTLTLAPLIQSFFADRLIKQKQASPHTICSYRDTFVYCWHFSTIG